MSAIEKRLARLKVLKTELRDLCLGGAAEEVEAEIACTEIACIEALC